jgi:hypothetical protein
MSEGNGKHRPLSHSEIEEIVKKAADAVAWKDYGVKPTDWKLMITGSKKYDAAVIGGPTVIVCISPNPKQHPRFKEILFRAISSIKKAKQCVEIEVYEVLKAYETQNRVRFIREVGCPPESLFPRMLPKDRFDVQVKTIVKVRDRETGIVEEQEVRKGSIFDAILSCEVKISEIVSEINSHSKALVLRSQYEQWDRYLLV